jgi:hypothetical protein
MEIRLGRQEDEKTRLSEEFSQRHFSTKSHAAYDAAKKNIVSLRANTQQPTTKTQQPTDLRDSTA